MAKVSDSIVLRGISGREYEVKFTNGNLLKIERLLPQKNLYVYVSKMLRAPSYSDQVCMSLNDIFIFMRYYNPKDPIRNDEQLETMMDDIMGGSNLLDIQVSILAALAASGVFGTDMTNSNKAVSQPNSPKA